MDQQEAQAFLGTTATGTNPPAQPDSFPQIIDPRAKQLAPLTQDAALATQSAASLKNPLTEAFKRSEAAYRQQVEQPGVPLDIETGASPWEKFVLSFHREKENQISYLQNKYGEENVRLDPFGDMIVRVMDSETGKPKDLKIDEATMSAKDLISLAGAVPEIAGGIIALRSGRGIPGAIGKAKGLLGLQRDVAATALGGEAAGLGKDIVSGLSTKGTEDIGQAAKERGAMAIGDVALGEVSLGAGRALNFMKSPLAGSRGPVQFDALAAQQYFKNKYGVEVPLSIGEATGSPLVSRTEAFMEKLPGGGTPFKELKGRQEQAFRQLQSIMMGKIPATDEAVGRATIDALMEEINPTTQAVETAKGALAKGGTAGIESVVTDLTLPERQLMRSQTGKEVRAGVVAKRDAAKSKADQLFGIVKSTPGGEGKVFEGEPLQKSFQDILDRLPSPEQTSEVPTGLVGPDGEPILRTETGKAVLKEFVPPNVLARLRAVTSLKDAKFSLGDLQQMRREVYDDIAKGEGVPGLGTHYLNDMGKSITRAIDEGIDKLPGGGGDFARWHELERQAKALVAQKKYSQVLPLQTEMEAIKNRQPIPGSVPTDATGDLKSALKAANEFYKKEVVPFNRIGLTEMFRNPDEAGGLADSEIVSRVFSGGKAVQNFGLMKEVLGETSPQFTKLKRAILDHILEKSREPGEDLINYSSLANNLSHLRTEYPEIAKDVFGNRLNELFRQGRFVQYAKDSKVSAEELGDLMADTSATASKFQDLIRAEAKRDEMYRNQILRDVATKELPDKAINPVEFVNRFVDKSKPEDVRQVMDLLGSKPDLVEDIRAKVVEKLFRNASRSATPGDIGRLLSEDPTRIVTGTSVFKQMEAPTMRTKLKTILGADVFNDLENYAKLQAGTEIKEQQFAAAGGLAAGMQIANLTRRGPLRYLYEAGKDWVVASLMIRAPLRQWLSSVPVSQEPGMASLILTSPAFLSQVAKEFPGVKGSMLINSIKQSVDKWSKLSQPQEKQPSILAPVVQPEEQRRQEAMRFLGSPMMALQNQLVPAIRTMDGKIVKATENEKTHNDIISKHGLKATDIDQRGFVDAQGNWHDREGAAQKTGLPTNQQPGRLHSTDLPRAQE